MPSPMTRRSPPWTATAPTGGVFAGATTSSCAAKTGEPPGVSSLVAPRATHPAGAPRPNAAWSRAAAAVRYHNAGSFSASTQRDGPLSGVIGRCVNDCPSQPSGRFSAKGAGANASVIGAKPTLA